MDSSADLESLWQCVIQETFLADELHAEMEERRSKSMPDLVDG